MSKISKQNTSNGRAWAMLLLAGGFEIGYAISVGGSKAFTVLTLYCLSVALKSIDVGIGYAVWAGIGAIGAAVFGSIFLEQPLTVVQIVWLAVIIVGLVWLKLADSPQLQARQVEKHK